MVETPHGFFAGREALELPRRGGGHTKPHAEYKNVPLAIATVVSARLATLHELRTVYDTQDLYDLLEVITVDAYNRSHANSH